MKVSLQQALLIATLLPATYWIGMEYGSDRSERKRLEHELPRLELVQEELVYQIAGLLMKRDMMYPHSLRISRDLDELSTLYLERVGEARARLAHDESDLRSVPGYLEYSQRLREQELAHDRVLRIELELDK